MTTKKKSRYQIGIDCGVKTGFSIWDSQEKKFVEISTLQIHQAIIRILELQKKDTSFTVWIEDARLRKWYGNNSDAKKQGAGSVKRDSKIWEDFCKDLEIEYHLIAPKNNKTKLDAFQFKNLTGCEMRTTEHSRDASMLVFGRN